VKKKTAFLASPIPMLNNEPSIQKVYKGCVAYTFIDCFNRRRFVLLDSNGEYKEGDKNYKEYILERFSK